MSSHHNKLDLGEIRDQLIRLEETIIFALIERSQFPQNPQTYIPGAVTDKFECSFLEFFLKETEKVHSLLRRYACPEEHPFTDWYELPDPIIQRDNDVSVLKANNINLNKKVMSLYLEKIVPMICKEGNQDFGSSSVCDINALQAISKRVHYGKFVVESKFQQQNEAYTKLIREKDSDGLMKLLTDEVVEAKLLQRVRLKASTYGQDPAQQVRAYKIDPEVPVKIYKDYLMPLTKEVELEYILRRLEGFSVSYYGYSGSLSHVAAKEHFSEESTNFISYPSIQQVFSSVLSSKSDYGVVPIRNSLSGLFKDTHELLFTTDAKVVGEFFLKIKFQLISTSSDKSKITKVYSHPDALVQCRNSLLKHCPGIKTIPVSSTAEGAEKASKEQDSAAIAHLDVLKLYPSLQVIQPDMQDDDNSYTVFLILSRTTHVTPSGKDKTILVFGVNDRPGALSSALGSFEKHHTNLASIHSRFNGNLPEFLIEFQGHISDDNVKKALEELQNHSTFIRILGSFTGHNFPKK
jgi:chorismate mutase